MHDAYAMAPAPPHRHPIRVLLADTHFTALWGLARLIRAEPQSLELVDVVFTPADAVLAARRLRPHIVLLDCSRDAEESLSYVPQLQEVGGLRVIVIAASIDPFLPRRARAAGAYGVLDKTASGDGLLRAIGIVHRRGCWVDPAATDPVSPGAVAMRRIPPL